MNRFIETFVTVAAGVLFGMVSGLDIASCAILFVVIEVGLRSK